MSQAESKSGETGGGMRFRAYAEGVTGGLRITVTAEPEPGVDLGALIERMVRQGRVSVFPGGGIVSIVPPVGPGTKVRRLPDGRFVPAAEGEPYDGELVAAIPAETERSAREAIALMMDAPIDHVTERIVREALEREPCTHPISTTYSTGLVTCPRCGQWMMEPQIVRMSDAPVVAPIAEQAGGFMAELMDACGGDPEKVEITTTPGLQLTVDDAQAYEMAGAGLATADELGPAVDRLRAELSPEARAAFDQGRQRYFDSHAAIDAVEELERDILDRRGLKHELRQVDPADQEDGMTLLPNRPPTGAALKLDLRRVPGAPSGWYRDDGRELAVCVSREPFDGDGKLKLHVSVSCKTRYPTWDELVAAKRAFAAHLELAIYLPPDSHYVNLHENTFHMWEVS